jgi:hypothetical protein
MCTKDPTLVERPLGLVGYPDVVLGILAAPLMDLSAPVYPH